MIRGIREAQTCSRFPAIEWAAVSLPPESLISGRLIDLEGRIQAAHHGATAVALEAGAVIAGRHDG